MGFVTLVAITLINYPNYSFVFNLTKYKSSIVAKLKWVCFFLEASLSICQASPILIVALTNQVIGNPMMTLISYIFGLIKIYSYLIDDDYDH